jgi:hypothetical protein
MTTVVMLDLGLGVLHLPGERHLWTRCGREMILATVGPERAVAPQADSRCPQCFPEDR